MKKILIIEDDISIADIEKDYLEANGYEVELVHDGLKAMDKFNEYNPDLVLLDLMLPGKDGFELCHDAFCESIIYRWFEKSIVRFCF